MAFNTFPTSSPWPPLELANDLNDNFSKTVEVSLSTNPVDGAVLVYDASADIWTDGQETVTLDDLTNVALDTAPTDGDILTYDASSDTWINSPAVTYSLGELDDVVLPTNVNDGDALIYDASSDTWITGSGGVTTLEALTDVVLSTTPTDGSALVYDASSDTWVDGTAVGGGSDPELNSQTVTSYTLVIGDAYNTVSMDNASANTLTIPTNASVAFDVGTVIAVLQEGAGTTTVSGDTGVTVNGTSGGSEDIGTQYASAALVKVGTDEWVVAVGSGSGGGGGSTTLTGLTDTAISTTPNDGDVLTYDASSDTWVDAATSPAMELIETLEASASSSLDFTGFDATKYGVYIFEFENVVPATDPASLWLRLSNDGGSTFESGAGSYRHSRRIFSTTGAASGGSTSDTEVQIDTVGGASGENGFSGTVKLYAAGDASKKTRFAIQGAIDLGGGDLYAHIAAGERLTAETNDGFRVLFSSGNISSGKVSMYGVRV